MESSVDRINYGQRVAADLRSVTYTFSERVKCVAPPGEGVS